MLSNANRNILITVDNGVIALDVKKQLTGSGYYAEIINFSRKEKIKEAIGKGIRLIITESSHNAESDEFAAKLAKENKLPVIYLSTGADNEKIKKYGFGVLKMPFTEEELENLVRKALSGDGEKVS
jgi:DNA-binding NtrC family response regulator